MSDDTTARQLNFIGQQLDRGDERFEHMERRMDALEQEAAQAKAWRQTQGSKMDRNTSMTEDIYGWMQAGERGLKVLGWAGAVAKWIGMMATAAAAVYAAWYMVTHGGKPPT